MRSAKKALRMLENPEENLPEKDQVNSARQVDTFIRSFFFYNVIENH